jgi:hypothetical protein
LKVRTAASQNEENSFKENKEKLMKLEHRLSDRQRIEDLKNALEQELSTADTEIEVLFSDNESYLSFRIWVLKSIN